MARSAGKPERETDETETGFNKAGQNDRDAPRGEAADIAVEAASITSSKRDIEFAGFQTGQFESLERCSKSVPKQARRRAPLRSNLPRCGSRFTRSISSFWFRH